MSWITSISAALAALVVAWPKIAPHLPAWAPAFLGGTRAESKDPAGAPECMTEPSKKPPAWVADWVAMVVTEGGNNEPAFTLESLRSGDSLFDVARKARDKSQKGGAS